METTQQLPQRDQQILRRFQSEANVRSSFEKWCRACGFAPAAHHVLIIEALETLVSNLFTAIARGHEVPDEPLRLMVMMPPGSAKSSYLSKLFPPWFLAQFSRLTTLLHKQDRRPEPLGILALSHSADLANDFGRACRNVIISNESYLGYKLTNDSRAVDKWAVTNGGYYQAGGVGTGISGRRCHLGSIDDFCASEADAHSKLFNDYIWNWYQNDFVRRLQPIAARVIIANHRDEDDLCGRILSDKEEAAKWRVIRLRLVIETPEQAEDDPLHRPVGGILWPEYFTHEQVEERMKSPQASGLEQQEPAPQSGAFFLKDNLLSYTKEDYEALVRDGFRCYCASDHAVSTKQTADRTCLIAAAHVNGQLFVLPDIVWDRIGPKNAVEAMLKMARERRPLYWWAERGHISKSIGPFLQDRMLEERVYVPITEVTPVKDKRTRAQSIKGMCDMGLVRFPKFAPWWSRAEREILMFDKGKNDDFVDALALLGMGVAQMTSGPSKKVSVKEEWNVPWVPTMRHFREVEARKKRTLRIAQLDR